MARGNDNFSPTPAPAPQVVEPHRGSTVMILGILSFVFAPIVLGPIAWIMGRNDLRAMDEGRMDRSGRDNTNVGRICGMISTIISGSLVGLGFGFFLCCMGGTLVTGLMGSRSSATFSTVATAIESTTPQTVPSLDGKCALTLPPGWKGDDSMVGDDDAVIEAANSKDALFVNAFSKSKTDLAAKPTLKDQAATALNALKAKCENVKMLRGPTEVMIASRRAIQYELEGTLRQDRKRNFYVLVTVDGKDDFYEIRAWTLNDRADTNRPKLLEIVNSFRETADPAP